MATSFLKIACALILATALSPFAADAQDPGQSYPANDLDIASNGNEVRIAEVPGLFQTRFHFDRQGHFLYSVAIDLTTGRILGVSQAGPGGAEGAPNPSPSSSGPPANYTGIWLLAEFPGGGAVYGEFASGVRTGTYVVQPDGTVDYYPN